MTTEELLNMLPKGKENGIKNEDLQRLLKTDCRGVSHQIQKARLNGALICSGNAGYYLPADQEEVKEFYNIMRARCLSLLTALKPAAAYLKNPQGIEQLEITSLFEDTEDPRKG